MRLRSTLNPEEQTNLIDGPTHVRKGPNQSMLLCALCNETYYVDDDTFAHAMSAMEEGFDNPFCCDDCEADHEEISH